MTTDRLSDELQNQIKNWEIRHYTLLNTLSDALITIDRQGIIKTFNQAAESIFGYRAHELIGQKINMLMPQPHNSEHDKYMDRYINTGQKHVIGTDREVMAQRKDGSTFPIELAISEMWQDGELQFTGLIKDITERKKIELMKNEFISTVSHELRTPLTSIRGALGLINSGLCGTLPDKVNELLTIATNNTERLLLLINDILDIEKIESGHLRFDFKRLVLADLIENAIADCSSYAVEHRIQFEFVPEDRLIQVNADPERLIQVINNLLSNAAKFSPQNGTVDVSLNVCQGFARISVRDHGTGIPLDFLPRLFDKFSQVDGSDNRHTGGTGLGLSIAKAIVEKHQGNISVETAEGSGTTFHVDLPLQTINDIKDRLPANTDPTATILIIEDDPDVAHLIKRILFDAGFNAEIAYDTIQAKQLLQQNHYEAITLDVILPGQSGLEFLKELQNQGGEIPVVIVSVDDNKKYADSTNLKQGIVDWLQKPIDSQKLIDAVQSIKSASLHSRRPLVLQVEDEADVRKIVELILTDTADVVAAGSLREARQQLSLLQFDLVLLDVGLPDGSGLTLLPEIRQRHPHTKVVIFSAQDVGEGIASQVSAALVKSVTSNFKLIQTVKAAIK
ncbi:response regulator [Methylomonas methanica]|uniref:Sensor protein FixL n=1 Tax=Methylomonas methanica (strain DSM 25384 / MC09) TaxID=857087 RepID=G0A1N8_METMM|nr:response regulator [Methylomonas methanica]AEG00099.1 PAS/PAC sensor hybrid histidine kinase [Methylomonas methanica MC09]